MRFAIFSKNFIVVLLRIIQSFEGRIRACCNFACRSTMNFDQNLSYSTYLSFALFENSTLGILIR